MNLFSAIAAAAVICASFIADSLAESKNGRVHVWQGTTTGAKLHVRPTGSRGSICSVQIQWHDSNQPFSREVNCVTWHGITDGKNWNPIMPELVAEDEENFFVG